MKRINIFRFLVIIVIIASLLAIHTNAVSVIRTGYYYQKVIYIQNKATGIYNSAVIQGVVNWNNAGISPRSVVINTSSSNKVYDDPFTSEDLVDAVGVWFIFTYR